MSNKRKITYKCPYCDKRFDKENLVIHVGDSHDEMIPENYSAFRFVFDYVNKKPAGYNGKCIICGKETGWDETKGKYNRLCNNPACKKKYIQSFEERMMKSKGVTRISSTAEGQAKMLANRKISGEYKFQDGGIKTYTGTYEKKALEFMDKVMNIQSIDVTTPGPIMEYDFEGKKHIYISDIYYAPYNLIIEVKDGGNNPNMRSMPEYRAKQIAKEKYIIKNTDYNYLRLTNNDFSQLLAVFMQLKMEMSNDTSERVIRINEGDLNYIKEGFLKSEPDILYNKEAFDNGDINICFITGHSGSGKSTLAHGQESETVEVYELDDLQCIADRFTMTNLKEYGDLIYTYFKGPGKQFYTTWDQLKEDMTPGKDYEDKLYPGFVAYAIDWAKKHKDKKYIIEGVWLFCNDETGKPYFEPSYFKDYAFYIKGTSAIKSKWRAAKRDMKYDQKEESHNRLFWIKSFTKSFFLKNWKWYKFDEKRIQIFRDYFKNKPETVLIKENVKEDTNMTEAMNALMTGYIPGSVDNPNNVYIVNYMQNNVFSDEDPNEDCIGVSDNIKLTNLIVRDNTGMLKRVDESFLKDKDYKVYILEISRDEVNEKLGKYLGGFVKKDFIYETLTGHKLYTKDQIQFESAFIPTLDYYKYMETFREICDNYFSAKDKKEIPVNESTFIPKEVRYFNKSGLMYSEKIHNLDEYINSKPNKVLECLDITINN